MPGVSTIIEELLSFAWRHWKAILSVGALISVLVYISILKGEVSHYHKLSDQFAEQNRMLEATYSAAQNTARANNLEAVRKAEADGNAISERTQNDLQKELADARALAASYARRVRAASAANQGAAGQSGISEASNAAISANSPGGNALVPEDDLRICADNTTKAKGWQQWFAAVKVRYDGLTSAP